MTEQEKARKAAELLVAWADGKKLEHIAFFSNIKDQVFIDYKDNMSPEINSSNIECWRVKPEPIKQWYRVALLKCNNEYYTCTCNGDEKFKYNVGFVKWITERIEYEVPCE